MAIYDGTPQRAGTVATGDTTTRADETLLVDASSGPVTVTLLHPSAITEVTVKKIDSSSNVVTIATPGSETIDGDSFRTISAQYVSRTIESDGSDYFIV